MFMSMGEPFYNYNNLEAAISYFSGKYPKAQLLVSTSCPQRQIYFYFDKFINLCKKFKNVGIQFSVHASNDDERCKIIPTSTLTLKDIGLFGAIWAKRVGRKPFFNYCVHENNSSITNVEELKKNFNPDVWECTLSVICEKDNTIKNAIEQKLHIINNFSELMKNEGYSIRIFNPGGQDDIGGGCGQLWYFRDWLKNKNK